MTIRRGMSGPSVKLIQQSLADAKLYISPIDSSFGGGTESAVKLFQAKVGLPVTGIVDQATWSRLLPNQPMPEPPLAHANLVSRCLALTGSFETGAQPPDCFCGLAGDFDGQGLSFGALQWNIGQGTLQSLLKDMFGQHADICQNIFHENTQTVIALAGATLAEQLAFVRSIQSRGHINEPWRGMLKMLGRTPEFQAIQAQHALGIYNQGLTLCATFQLQSQRAAALMFDVVTQNGGIGSIVKAEIMADYAKLPSTGAEVERMRSVANHVAAHCRVQFVDDVRTRKLTIAEGAGTVHGTVYDLEDMFSLTLDPAALTPNV